MAATALDNEAVEPPHDCPLCPRLAGFRDEWRGREPGWFNGPVPTLLPPEGEDAVRFLVVGLAPGLRGANRTGRPFTGDYAGDLLYSTMLRFGLAKGEFRADPRDSLQLVGAAVTNAVRCVPPENKPTGVEVTTCRAFLAPTIQRFPGLRAMVALGAIAHGSVLRALGLKLSAHPFKHGGRAQAGGVTLFSSYHCSRYNTNTGVLTEAMFHAVFADAAAALEA